MDLKRIERPANAPAVLLPGTRFFKATVHDGQLGVIAAAEPWKNDGTVGLHVSVSHSMGRAASEELHAIAEQLFGTRGWEEDNKGGDPASGVRHLWEM